MKGYEKLLTTSETYRNDVDSMNQMMQEFAVKSHQLKKNIDCIKGAVESVNVAVEEINEFLNKFLKNGITYKTEIKEYEIYVDIQGEDVNHLIGYLYTKINSLQYIVLVHL